MESSLKLFTRKPSFRASHCARFSGIIDLSNILDAFFYEGEFMLKISAKWHVF
jgi:hypothetical protein